MTSLYYLLFLFATLLPSSSPSPASTVHIYSNLAEIIQDLPSSLPLQFEEEQWKDIRPDSLTLLGTNVTSQTITEKKESRNGRRIFFRSASSPSGQGAPNIVEGILVDEERNLIKDPSIGSGVFYTLPPSQIFDISEPPKSKFYVDFTYDHTAASKPPRVSYLQDKLTWKTRYQLNMFGDDDNSTPTAQLIAFADIRNDGKSNISIRHAELIAGDSNLRMNHGSPSTPPRFTKTAGYGAGRVSAEAVMVDLSSASSSPPSVSEGKELAGLYVFSIDKPFLLEPKTNYLLAMFNVSSSSLHVERRAVITKNFYQADSKGKAQRFYRFESDRFLPRGNCIVREDERLVGETDFKDVAEKEKVEFSVGEDPDVTYKTTVVLKSTRAFNETGIVYNGQTWRQRTENVYNVTYELKNFKKREVKVEFEERFPSFDKVDLEETAARGAFVQEGTSVKAKKTMKGGEKTVFSFTVKTLD